LLAGGAVYFRLLCRSQDEQFLSSQTPLIHSFCRYWARMRLLSQTLLTLTE
jgi:hypothetical protein